VVAISGSLETQLGRQLSIGRIGQDRSVLESEGRNPALALTDLDDELLAFAVLLDVYPVVGDLVLAEKLLTADGSPGTGRRRTE